MNDIERVEWYFGKSLKCEEVADAWSNIKEILRISDNSNHVKCTDCGAELVEVKQYLCKNKQCGSYVEKCGRKNISNNTEVR